MRPTSGRNPWNATTRCRRPHACVYCVPQICKPEKTLAWYEADAAPTTRPGQRRSTVGPRSPQMFCGKKEFRKLINCYSFRWPVVIDAAVDACVACEARCTHPWRKISHMQPGTYFTVALGAACGQGELLPPHVSRCACLAAHQI
jgi:hypothetical protein